MYTEAEAKTKLCPFIRDTESVPDVISRTSPRLCAASECMAWRVSSPATKAVIDHLELEDGAGPTGEGWVIVKTGVDDPEPGHPAYAWKIWEREAAPAKAETGFCGAFGPTKAGAA